MFCCDQSCSAVPTPAPEYDNFGHRVFFSLSGQVVLVIEGAVGPSGNAVALSLDSLNSDSRPDLWVIASRPLGNGSTAVCDTGSPSAGGGGIPAIDPPSFAPQSILIRDALADFACRFDSSVNAGAPCTIVDAGRDSRLVSPNASAQFCDFVGSTAQFPPGDTVLTARLRDVLGNPGPTAQIVVRVATPTPLR